MIGGGVGDVAWGSVGLKPNCDEYIHIHVSAKMLKKLEKRCCVNVEKSVHLS